MNTLLTLVNKYERKLFSREILIWIFKLNPESDPTFIEIRIRIGKRPRGAQKLFSRIREHIRKCLYPLLS